MDTQTRYSAFVGSTLIAAGGLRDLLIVLKARRDTGDQALTLVFEDDTGKAVDFELSGTPDEVLQRYAASPVRGPGRPRLGVHSREISLLPRHWEWLEQQPNGVSATLRRLVEQARKTEPDAQRARLTREAAGRFMTAMAGDLPGFEEATRALYAGDQPRLESLISAWPPAIQDFVLRLTRSV